MSMTIFYPLGNNLYINLTNRCNCSCVFCLRGNADHVQDTDNLWLEHEPSIDEVLKESEKWDLIRYEEIVFCGYGEPTKRLDDLLEIARRLKQRHQTLRFRINTNGLSDLQYGRDTAKEMAGIIHRVSISLNASNPAHYYELTRSAFGPDSFAGLLAFAKRCKAYGMDVRFSIVDLLPETEMEACKKLSAEMEIPLFIRAYEPKR